MYCDLCQSCTNLVNALFIQSIIGQRYGSVVNDSCIPEDKFEILMKTAKESNVTDSDLLEKWYRKDGNNVPPVYVLQVIFLLYFSVKIVIGPVIIFFFIGNSQ